MNLFGGCLAQKVNEEGREAKTEQQMIYCFESTMKEFDEHFVEKFFCSISIEISF
jgi:hypothetical protein